MGESELSKAIQARDECSREDAQRLITEMVEEVIDGRNPEEVLRDNNFELDYFLDIVP